MLPEDQVLNVLQTGRVLAILNCLVYICMYAQLRVPRTSRTGYDPGDIKRPNRNAAHVCLHRMVAIRVQILRL